MTTTKRKAESGSVRFAPVKSDSPAPAVRNTLGKRLAEAAHAMAEEHFRKVDEFKNKVAVDKEAERKINALFDKYAQDADTFQSRLDQLVSGE